MISNSYWISKNVQVNVLLQIMTDVLFQKALYKNEHNEE